MNVVNDRFGCRVGPNRDELLRLERVEFEVLRERGVDALVA